jgi:nitroimidazol reductase NimA-like FMN-containing flavoprotein (pyridoxamine 5'-phosphate oxidase superfamily)
MSFHVRRKDREITDPIEMRQVLKATKYVTVALCMNNEPYLVALSHGYDQSKNCMYFHCAPEGKKIIYAKANPHVWGQAVLDFGVTEECDYAYTSVQFQGKLSLIIDLTEKRHAMEILVRQVSLNPEAKLAQIKPEKLAPITMGRIDISYMSGKKHHVPKNRS